MVCPKGETMKKKSICLQEPKKSLLFFPCHFKLFVIETQIYEFIQIQNTIEILIKLSLKEIHLI